MKRTPKVRHKTFGVHFKIVVAGGNSFNLGIMTYPLFYIVLPVGGIKLIKDLCNLLAKLNYKRFMFKKLCILLIFSKLKVIKLLIDKYRTHNLYAIFAKLLNICKQIAGNLVNESGNVPRRGVVPKFSDLEVVL